MLTTGVLLLAAGGLVYAWLQTRRPVASLESQSRPGGDAVKAPANDQAVSKTEVAQAEQKDPAKATSQVSAPAAPSPPAPWQAALESTNPPPPYTEFAFQSPSRISSGEDLAAWFEPAPGAGLRLGSTTVQQVSVGTLEGTGRLKCPWPADGVLRMTLDNFNRLRMHFFHDLEGVSLIYYEDQNYRWAAYGTTREPGQPTPKTWALTATDEERSRRCELRFGGPVELRYRDGELILSRGDIVLLAAPLPGAPTAVFWEGRARVEGLELVRASGGPFRLSPGPVAVDVTRPGDLAWQKTANTPATLDKFSAGAVRLSAEAGPKRSEYYTPLPVAGWSEVILQLADVSAGASVFLGDENGQANKVVRFYLDERSGQLVAGVRKSDDAATLPFAPLGEKPVAFVSPNCWVKLLYGCGVLRAWIGSDGEHWAPLDSATDDAQPGIRSVGLQVVAKRAAGLTLQRIQMRNLSGLSALADDALVARAPSDLKAKSLADWLQEVAARQPENVAAADWLRACTLRTLAAGAAAPLANSLLEAWLDDAAERQLPIEQQLAALDDALLLCSELRDGRAMRIGIPSRYLRLGLSASDRQGLPAWTTIRNHYLSAPALNWRETPTDLDRALHSELVQAAYGRQRGEAAELVHRLRFFHHDRDRSLVDVVEMLSQQSTGQASAGDFSPRLKDSWRQPLVEELSKETYNALSELQAVLESEAWDDASRTVATLDPGAAPGVAPYLHDKALLASLPVSLQLIQEDYPQLRQALGDKLTALARLRVNQAIAAGDAARLELATVQFAGTPPAADAHRWLGDRSLASGWFARAIKDYQRAQLIEPALADELTPRIRLAAAMLGTDLLQPATNPVQFGEVSLSAAEFEALVREMRTRAGGNGAGAHQATNSSTSVPAPTGFEVRRRTRFEGPVGERPSAAVRRAESPHELAWPDRQLATAIHSGVLYVANRFQVSAFDLIAGQRKWSSESPQGQMQPAQDWPNVAMRPLITADRVFVRQLYSPSPQLVCLDKATGKLLWSAESGEREPVVSDPLLVEGQLVALQLAVLQDQRLLKWCVFDQETGEILRQRDLVRLRSSWHSHSCCEVAPLDDGLLVVLGGLTLAVDAAGRVRWIRNQLAIPAEADPDWVLQSYQPPLVVADRAYVTQPGVRTVDCLDVATGRRHWSVVLPEVTGLVGFVKDRLLVRAERGIVALQVADGSTAWRYDTDNWLGFELMDGQRLLISTRERLPGDPARWQCRLAWLGTSSGNVIATVPLPGLGEDDPRVGPLVASGDHLFTFYGQGAQDPARELVELTPSGMAEAIAAQNAWQRLSLNQPVP